MTATAIFRYGMRLPGAGRVFYRVVLPHIRPRTGWHRPARTGCPHRAPGSFSIPQGRRMHGWAAAGDHRRSFFRRTGSGTGARHFSRRSRSVAFLFLFIVRELIRAPVGRGEVIAGSTVSQDPIIDGEGTGPDPCPRVSSGTGANARQNYSYKPVFFESGHLKQEKTVQFSGVSFIAKTGICNGPCRAMSGPENAYMAENKSGSCARQKPDEFSGKFGRSATIVGL